MNKITMLLLVVLFVGGCKCREERKDSKELSLVLAGRRGDGMTNPIFSWSAPQPVYGLWLVCGEVSSVPPDPNDHGIGVSSTYFYSGGNTSGKIETSLDPNTEFYCNVQIHKEGTSQILVSNKVWLVTGPLTP